MHERHIKRASAIISATDLLPELAAITNGYLIPVSYLDKMAELVAMQPGHEFKLIVHKWTYHFSWTARGDDPRDYEYSAMVNCGYGRLERSAHTFSLANIVAIGGLMSVRLADRVCTMGDFGLDTFTSNLYVILRDI